MLKPGVSAVVCCYNSAAVIEHAIRALSAQEVPAGAGYEVILIDNNCIDSTVDLARAAWSSSRYPLRVIRETEPGLVHARRAGVENAHYAILLFVDDDNILGPGWITTLLPLYARLPQVGAAGCKKEPLFMGRKPAWFDSVAGIYACKRPLTESGHLPRGETMPGAGLSFRTALVQSLVTAGIPFFLEDRKNTMLTRGQDSELCLRAQLTGWNLWYENSIMLEHCFLPSRLTWDYALAAKREGGAAAVILKIYKKLAQHEPPLTYEELSADLERKWRYFWKKIENEAELKEEGSLKAFRYSYLQGFTEKLKSMGAEIYDRVREQLIGFYSQAT